MKFSLSKLTDLAEGVLGHGAYIEMEFKPEFLGIILSFRGKELSQLVPWEAVYASRINDVERAVEDMALQIKRSLESPTNPEAR